MGDLIELRSVWEGLAESDPFWAILSDPRRKGGKWDPGEFFATGDREIESLRGYLRESGLPLPESGPSLDFGCGVGRLTQPMSRYWPTAVGLDISQGMVDRARSFNKQGDRCEYLCNDRPTLPFPSSHFQLIYSNIVLQHIPTEHAQNYVSEFVRTLRPGGVAVFQLCDADKGPRAPTLRESLSNLRVKLALGTRLRRTLNRFGLRADSPPSVAPSPSYSMNPTPEGTARAVISAAGGRILDVRFTNATDADFNGSLQFLQSEPSFGYVSKLYSVTK